MAYTPPGYPDPIRYTAERQVDPLTRLQLAQQRIGGYLTGLETTMGPGPQELAARQAMEEAMSQQRGAVAGQSGAQAAIAQQRLAQAMPVMAGKQAQVAAQARAADEQARQARLLQALGLYQQGAQQLSAAEMAQRQQEEARRRAMLGGLFDLGATGLGFALGGPAGGAIGHQLAGTVK